MFRSDSNSTVLNHPARGQVTFEKMHRFVDRERISWEAAFRQFRSKPVGPLSRDDFYRAIRRVRSGLSVDQVSPRF